MTKSRIGDTVCGLEGSLLLRRTVAFEIDFLPRFSIASAWVSLEVRFVALGLYSFNRIRLSKSYYQSKVIAHSTYVTLSPFFNTVTASRLFYTSVFYDQNRSIPSPHLRLRCLHISSKYLGRNVYLQCLHPRYDFGL